MPVHFHILKWIPVKSWFVLQLSQYNRKLYSPVYTSQCPGLQWHQSGDPCNPRGWEAPLGLFAVREFILNTLKIWDQAEFLKYKYQWDRWMYTRLQNSSVINAIIFFKFYTADGVATNERVIEGRIKLSTSKSWHACRALIPPLSRWCIWYPQELEIW